LVEKIGEKLVQQKGDIQREITILQSNLNIVTGQKVSFLNEKRESLIDLHNILSNFIKKLNVTYSSPLCDYSHKFYLYENIVNLKNDEMIELDNASNQLNLAFSKYLIFWREPELGSELINLVEETEILGAIKRLQIKITFHKHKQVFDYEKLLDDSLKLNLKKDSDSMLEKIVKERKNLKSYIKESNTKIYEKYFSVLRLKIGITNRISQLLKKSYND